MTPTEYLEQLQNEAGKTGFHPKLRVWVDDHSSVARVLRKLDDEGARLMHVADVESVAQLPADL